MMKRMLYLVAGVLVALGLTACANSPAPGTTVASSPAFSATTTEFDPFALKWGDTVMVGDLSVMVGSPTLDTEAQFVSEGEKVVYCEVIMTNEGSEPISYNALSFTLYDMEGRTYSAFGASSQSALSSGDLLPGRIVKGVVAYDLPEAATASYVDFQASIMDDTQASWGN